MEKTSILAELDQSRYLEQKKTVVLGFDDTLLDGEYYLRGGLCWPRFSPGKGLEGFAVLAGYNIESHGITLFEEHPYKCVSPLATPEGEVLDSGLAPWLNHAASRYYCERFYVPRSYGATADRYRMELFRSKLVLRPPMLIELGEMTPGDLEQVVWGLVQERRLIYVDGGYFHRCLQNWNAEEGRPVIAEAVGAVLHGLLMHPYKTPAMMGIR